MMQEVEEALQVAEKHISRKVPQIVKKGILTKRSRSKYLSGPWTLRTFILDSNSTLSYYDGKTFKGEVALAGTSVNHVAQDAADGRTFPFQISNISSVKRTQGTTLLLAAGSFQEADDWVRCLAHAAAGSTSTGAAGYITFEVRRTSYISFSTVALLTTYAPLSSLCSGCGKFRDGSRQSGGRAGPAGEADAHEHGEDGIARQPAEVRRCGGL